MGSLLPSLWSQLRIAAANLAPLIRAANDERVDPGEEPVAVRPPRGKAQSLRVDERRGGRGLGLEQRHVREARHPGVEPVHHVEVALPKRRGDVRAHADGDPHRRAR